MVRARPAPRRPPGGRGGREQRRRPQAGDPRHKTHGGERRAGGDEARHVRRAPLPEAQRAERREAQRAAVPPVDEVAKKRQRQHEQQRQLLQRARVRGEHRREARQHPVGAVEDEPPQRHHVGGGERAQQRPREHLPPVPKRGHGAPREGFVEEEGLLPRSRRVAGEDVGKAPRRAPVAAPVEAPKRVRREQRARGGEGGEAPHRRQRVDGARRVDARHGLDARVVEAPAGEEEGHQPRRRVACEHRRGGAVGGDRRRAAPPVVGSSGRGRGRGGGGAGAVGKGGGGGHGVVPEKPVALIVTPRPGWRQRRNVQGGVRHPQRNVAEEVEREVREPQLPPPLVADRRGGTRVNRRHGGAHRPRRASPSK
ncbi:hypothetical protein BU14_0518s0018 [Porphyra umbilicalis]|uniref:Uncharacterized protein n=1 Tax=Porphyra umbilicalis TaxID=2786 RepID=A0A1X6NT10_PORUM|nr:hypothetical protein BU14_0518s0018 [Porphyra umbilicalis]|eukprot:OSX71626.1 hypothetical protein BU14_0518s0018 [Porphyra umbilicalis]